MKEGNDPKIKLKKSQLFTKFYQFWYLTFSNFNKNNLWDSACSCSFGFVFSFVPIVLIIVTVLIGVLKVSPAAINYIFEFGSQIEDVFDITPLINNILNRKTIRIADIFLAFWVIWMARRLFLSIVRGINSIFNSHEERKGLFIQLFTFLSEFVMVVIFVTITLFAFTFRKLFANSLLDNSLFAFFRESFPQIFRERSNVIFESVTYFLLFVFSFYVFRFISGTKPSVKTCLFYAALSTAVFFVFSYVLNKSLNVVNYNIVYGTISTLIILMVKVYFFFVIFLFGAQMVYVSQFFDNLLLAELYLLPTQDEPGMSNTIRRKMFINSTVLQTENNTVHYKAGDFIYATGDSVKSVFYLRKGEVVEENDNFVLIRNEGAFFGEIPVLLKTNRTTTARATTDCEILEIPEGRFLQLLNENPKVSSLAMEQLTTSVVQ